MYKIEGMTLSNPPFMSTNREDTLSFVTCSSLISCVRVSAASDVKSPAMELHWRGLMRPWLLPCWLASRS